MTKISKYMDLYEEKQKEGQKNLVAAFRQIYESDLESLEVLLKENCENASATIAYYCERLVEGIFKNLP